MHPDAQFRTILWLLVLVCVAISLFSVICPTPQPTIVTGGKVAQLFINDDAKLVVDGHNLIHDLTKGRRLTTAEFATTLGMVTKLLLDALPEYDVHIVIKNPPARVKQSKVMLTRSILQLSRKYPSVTYHIAYAAQRKCKLTSRKNVKSTHRKRPSSRRKRTKQKRGGSQSTVPCIYTLAENAPLTVGGRDKVPHYMKGRDDYLTIYLASDAYIVSKDRFRDFADFRKIPPFIHYTVRNGVVVAERKLEPKHQFRELHPPGLGNHFIYTIMSAAELKRTGATNGSIYLDNDSVFPRMYLAKK